MSTNRSKDPHEVFEGDRYSLLQQSVWRIRHRPPRNKMCWPRLCKHPHVKDRTCSAALSADEARDEWLPGVGPISGAMPSTFGILSGRGWRALIHSIGRSG